MVTLKTASLWVTAEFRKDTEKRVIFCHLSSFIDPRVSHYPKKSMKFIRKPDGEEVDTKGAKNVSTEAAQNKKESFRENPRYKKRSVSQGFLKVWQDYHSG
jgi:hypothetical protein